MTASASGPRRLAVALLFASLVVAVLASRSYVEFDRVRVRVVPAPRALAEARSLVLPLAGLAVLEGSWSAVIVRVRAPDDRPVALAVRLDGRSIGAVRLAADQSRRIDMAAWLAPGASHRLEIVADQERWWLEYVELANVHGFSSGLFRFEVVPRQRTRPGRVPLWSLPVVLAALTVLRPRLAGGRHRWLRWMHGTLAALVAGVLVAILVAPLVTPYRVLIAVSTLLWCTAIVYAVPLGGLAAAAARRVRASPLPRWAPHAATVLLVCWTVTQFYDPASGLTRMIGFGAAFQGTALPALRETPRAVTSEYGYDGQFYAQLALDPLLRSDDIVSALDTPAYRGRRILMAWAAYLAGLGRPWWVLQAYALINVVCWLLLARVLLAWLPAGAPKPVLAWIACLLSHGLLASIRHALPDGPSLLLLTLGVLAVERGRSWAAAGTLAAAGLTRETNLLGAVMLVPPHDISRQSMASLAARLSLVVAPLVAWILYLGALDLPLHDPGRRNFAPPLSGYIGAWVAAIRLLEDNVRGGPGWSALTTQVALTAQLIHLVRHREPADSWWRIGAVYGVLTLVLGAAVWEGHPGAVTRVVLPMTVAFNIRIVRSRWFWLWWIAGNANLVAGLHEIGVGRP